MIFRIMTILSFVLYNIVIGMAIKKKSDLLFFLTKYSYERANMSLPAK